MEEPMSESLYALALLACPVIMGGMMWMMMRGGNKQQSDDTETAGKQAELAGLQAQIDQLQAAQRDREPTPEARRTSS
jgi:hypothetical protein